MRRAESRLVRRQEISENADLLDLPPRQDLDGWRVLFRPSTDPDDITIYAGAQTQQTWCATPSNSLQ